MQAAVPADLEALSRSFPSIEAAATQIACLEASRQLPKGTVHVLSDVHGEYKKLHHVLGNASGSLRPLVERVFAELTGEERNQLLNIIYYPAPALEHLHLVDAGSERCIESVATILRRQFVLISVLARHYNLEQILQTFPADYAALFRELFWEAHAARPAGYTDIMLHTLCKHGAGLTAVRTASRAIRRLAVAEVVVAGDMGDRGERLDKVVALLMQQQRVAVAWGNHDLSWMGAALGHEALIATVLRISLRHHRLAQLEEGFGISLQPLERLAREVYGDDPAVHFQSRGTGPRETSLIARMHKAITIIQFKLEAQAIERHPEYDMRHRALITQIDRERGTVRIDERVFPLTDTALPTLDPKRPTSLCAAEVVCMQQLKQAFLDSAVLARQMAFLADRGSTHLIRDQHLIFHGCVPVDATGEFLALQVDGTARRGRPLFGAIDTVVRRAFGARRLADLDLLWYLWTGARSPMFGKDRMTTFESYFVADIETHREAKNPYFDLLNSREFCRKVLSEFGADPSAGLIVNGHVPVKHGERPLKDCGQAISIDGGFAESYGDRGYTLILDSTGTFLAEHHHFESVVEAVTQGADIIPRMTQIRQYAVPRRCGDTEGSAAIERTIAMLERLIDVYRSNMIAERDSSAV